MTQLGTFQADVKLQNLVMHVCSHGKYVDFIQLKLKYNRETIAKALQTEILKNKMLNKAWDRPFPNLGSTRISSYSCKFMGNFVAFPFQMLKRAPANQ